MAQKPKKKPRGNNQKIILDSKQKISSKYSNPMKIRGVRAQDFNR